MNLPARNVLVIGLGESGLAMAKWLARQGAVVRVADSRRQPPNVDALRASVPQAQLHAGPFEESALSGIDLLAISPGVAVQEPLVQQAMARGVPVVSEIELFAWGVRQIRPRAKIIAITGPGGAGKTRLAQHAASDAAAAFVDGTLFVRLEDATSAGELGNRLATELEMTLSGGSEPLDQVIAALRDQQMLLVLDNFEQLAAGAPLVGTLLDACPRLKAIITSRVR